MVESKKTAAIGGLLHDIGKVVYRAEIDSGTHSAVGYRWLKNIAPFSEAGDILDCLRYHHKKALVGAKLSPSSPAYIVYIADNIAAGTDRREEAQEEGENAAQAPFIKTLPLASVFNLMNGGRRALSYEPLSLSPAANYPTEKVAKLTAPLYQQKTRALKDELESIGSSSSYINSLLCQLENILSFVPSSTCTKEVADISLFDHSKITAAVAASICAYLDESDRKNYKKELLENEREFMKEEAFLFFSCDFSGIQKFIYQVGSKDALKSLRSRSFILELLMEYLMDEILEECGLSRANLIYTGGGHSYLLLPNTSKTRDALQKFERGVNRWLREQFDNLLYLACAWSPVSANTLKNIPAEKSPYSALYKTLSRTVAEKKLRRYDAQELRALNKAGNQSGARECRICGKSETLRLEEDICSWCASFAEISSDILKTDIFAAVSETKPERGKCINLPNIYNNEKPRYIQFKSYEEALAEIKTGGVIRIYSKNNPHTGWNYSTNLYMGDYVYDKNLDRLATEAAGIKRIAILRADVDNLGRAFTSGFERAGSALSAEEKERYKTLSRTAALSRQLSMFFKYHLNTLLNAKDEGAPCFSLFGASPHAKKALIVYSGGDDVFMVGAWDDIVESAVEIRDAFKKFTGGSLTLSAGIAVYPYKFPIYRGARLAAELEAKSKQAEGKDSITLFTADGSHTYKWDDFSAGVTPKLRLIGGFLDAEDSERGRAFLYKLLQLLRGADNKINIARCAYLLTRLEPKSDETKKEAYRQFSQTIYEWATEPKARGELITAIQIYVYLTRERGA
ncbi:MAG: type III-A CRISPR-associated protein Cas10/Csm1 [Cloacibacillus sp.]